MPHSAQKDGAAALMLTLRLTLMLTLRLPLMLTLRLMLTEITDVASFTTGATQTALLGHFLNQKKILDK